MSVADKVASLVQAAAAGSAPSPEAPAGAPPPTGVASGAGSASADEANLQGTGDAASPEATTDDVTKTEHELLREKLRETRERVQARGLGRKAREQAQRAAALAQQAQADRDQAAADRARWADLGKSGNIIDTLKETGRDPAEVFKQMQAEALRAGTPEAQIEALAKRFESELSEVKKENQALRKERERDEAKRQSDAFESKFAADFKRVVADDAYGELRDEYGDDRLLQLVSGFRDAPEEVKVAEAKRVGVRLTSPERGLTMKEILSVLKAIQGEHDSGKATRRAARTAANPSQSDQQPDTEKPTVNGTAERRNADKTTTIGNDLASQRASGGKAPIKGTTAAQRVRERARRLG